MKANKVLYITTEMTPYVTDNPLSLKGRFLPQQIQELGHEIRTFSPNWGNINERRNQLHEVIRLSGMNIIIDDTDHPLLIKVASLQEARMQIYFIDNDEPLSHRSSSSAPIRTNRRSVTQRWWYRYQLLNSKPIWVRHSNVASHSRTSQRKKSLTYAQATAHTQNLLR